METPKYIVLSVETYLTLPELPMPSVADEHAPGVVYQVHKIGFYPATEEECRRHKLDADLDPDAGRYLLPTAVATVAKKKEFYRLPLSLAAWAGTVVAMAHAGANPLPCKIEFGILRDRHYAEIV